MAFLSKFTGPEIDRRLAQGTYDDAVNAGFTGTKEQFDELLAHPYDKTEQEKLNNKQDKEDQALETENKTVVGAINLLNSNKQDKTDERLTTDSKIVVEAINEVKYNTIVLDQKKQPREDQGFSTEQKTVVGAVNELHLKTQNLEDNKQNKVDDALDTNDTTVVGAINEVHGEHDKLNVEFGKHLDDYETFKSTTGSSLTGLQESITNLRTDKQDKTDYDLVTDDKRVVFAINEVHDALNAEVERATTEDARLEKIKVPYTDISDGDNPNRRTILLNNHDSISGFGTSGDVAYNLAMVSKWDKADFGAAGIPINLNGSAERPTYNDDKELAFKEEVVQLNETIATVNENLSNRISTLNQNMSDGFNTINGDINNEIRPAIEENKAGIDKNTKDIAVVNENLTNKIEETEEKLQEDINYLKPRVATLETLQIKSVDPDSENYAASYELQDSTGKVYGSRINIAKDQFLKNVSYENNTLILTFILADGTEFSQQIDLTDLIDEYVAGDHIEIKDTEDGKKSISVAKDPSLSSAIQIPIRTLRDQVYSQEDILEWFGATDVATLKQRIVREGQMYLKYGIQLSGNPYFYKMPIEYIAFESANQIKLVFAGLDTRNDVTSKYEILINLDGTIIEGNSNVKLTLLSLEPDLSQYALKSEIPDTSRFATTEALDTKADKTELENVVKYTDISDADDTPRKTIMLDNNDTLSAYNTAGTANNIAMVSKWDVVDLGSTSLPINLNGSKERPTYNDSEELALVSDISDPYEINLTNLLSAEDSESISSAIGGIDNLNATVQDNRIIVGTISNGSVSVSIRILGNITTLYYLLDSVLGLTLNEVAITNTSGTLSKSITTHSVLTENMVINSLNSDETTLPLSAAQGKALDNKITTLQTNFNTKQNSTDNNLSTMDKTVVGAINELLTKIQELENRLSALENPAQV